MNLNQLISQLMAFLFIFFEPIWFECYYNMEKKESLQAAFPLSSMQMYFANWKPDYSLGQHTLIGRKTYKLSIHAPQRVNLNGQRE